VVQALVDDAVTLDINPVMVRPRGVGVTAVDALIVPRLGAGLLAGRTA